MTSTYVYSDRGPAGTAHHNYLSDMLDGHTQTLLGKDRLRDAQCLEVGAGAGQLAFWLAAKASPHGRVLATDLDPMPIPQHPCLEVLRHDIVTEPVPDGPWDLIHARLVLVHLRERRAVLDKLAAALAPGGRLVIEDWDMTWRNWRVLVAPSAADVALFERFQNAIWDVLDERDGDDERDSNRDWASRVPAAMISAGLIDVSAEFYTQSWTGRSAAARLLAGNIRQIGDKLNDHGLDDGDLQRVRHLMANPKMMFRMPPMVSTIGYAPHGAGVA